MWNVRNTLYSQQFGYYLMIVPIPGLYLPDDEHKNIMFN